MNKIIVMLNLFSTPHDVLRKAFDALEFKGFFDYSMKNDSDYSLKAVINAFNSKKQEGSRLDETSNSCSIIGPVVYGNGGGRRYLVYMDGRIQLSKHHCHNSEKLELAKELGFDVS
ncbi:MAG: hypothetical protein ACP5OG_03050 [Candidatus Nanoarchaeia archaeon]